MLPVPPSVSVPQGLEDSLARFIPQSTPLILATTQNIPQQSLSIPQLPLPTFNRRRDKRPTPANPVAVATIDELVSTATETTFRSVLPCRQPG